MAGQDGLLRSLRVPPRQGAWVPTGSGGLGRAARPAADRFGRKPMLIAALTLTRVLVLARVFATSATELAWLRFVGGLGMGGAIPPVAAITAECASPRRRVSFVILTFIGFPPGAVVGGAIPALLMTRFGWPFVFEVGGAPSRWPCRCP